eukprot:5975314-Pyramimonas_sp.AAC.1
MAHPHAHLYEEGQGGTRAPFRRRPPPSPVPPTVPLCRATEGANDNSTYLTWRTNNKRDIRNTKYVTISVPILHVPHYRWHTKQ